MISLVAAMDENFGIGYQDKIPWNVPEDLKNFKTLTENGVVIMGRKTYDSIGHPLSNRINIVISRNNLKNYSSSLIIAHSVDEALKTAQKYHKNIFIIGGAEIYREFLNKNLVDKLCLSFIKGKFLADTFFPLNEFNHYELINQSEYADFIYKEYLVSFK